MENVDKVKEFEVELRYIRTPEIRTFAEEAIKLLPDYFFVVPASSTGKYHPAYTLGEGGLVRHVKGCIKIALELYRLEWWHFTPEEEELMLVALLLHDGWKSGLVQSEFSVTEHPIIASEEVKKGLVDKNLIAPEKLDFVCNGIKTHMGQWVQNSKTKEAVLEKPVDKYQKFIHLVDYLASRKCIDVNFGVQVDR